MPKKVDCGSTVGTDERMSLVFRSWRVLDCQMFCYSEAIQKLFRYHGHTKLVFYSDHGDLFDCQMVCYSDTMVV